MVPHFTIVSSVIADTSTSVSYSMEILMSIYSLEILWQYEMSLVVLGFSLEKMESVIRLSESVGIVALDSHNAAILENILNQEDYC